VFPLHGWYGGEKAYLIIIIIIIGMRGRRGGRINL